MILSGADGMRIHGQLFLPADLKPGEKRPAMIFFHGGSRRQMLLGFHSMDYYHNAYAMNQYLANRGYIVLSVNYRSGIGYGLNFREALNYGATGASEFNDVLGAGLYLRGREGDIFQNVYGFDVYGQMTVDGHDEVWDYLMAHVLTEAEMRGVQLEPPIRVAGYTKVKMAAEIWSACPKPDASFIVKYGKRIHLEPMIQEGAFRLSPAGKYRDSLNPAIWDTELEFTEEMYGATVSAPENRDYSIPMHRWTPIPVLGTVKGHLTSESDYYTACFSTKYDYRLFDDFDADACILVRDPARFVEQLRICVFNKLPDWKFLRRNVSYRDPCHPTLDNRIVYAKHLRYAYQSEFRMAWQPPENTEGLEYLSLRLGPLADFCDLLIL